MYLLQLRENEIFETLKSIKNSNFTVIGGYAVNAYTLPRFSIDCDIVVKDEKDLKKIEAKLINLNYLKIRNKSNLSYHEKFVRYEKTLENNFKVSIDILIKDVIDRQTNATFSANWVFENSKINVLKGKTINEKLKVRIIDIDSLFVMKMISCRLTDIRDIFMLSPKIKNKKWVKQEISKRYDFSNRLSKVKEVINSKQFKDGLQGVYGYVDDDIFNKHKDILLKL